jgi:hypothetical protein
VRFDYYRINFSNSNVGVRGHVVFSFTILIRFLREEFGLTGCSGTISAFVNLSEKSFADTTILDGLTHSLFHLVVGFIEVLIKMDLSSNGNLEGLVLGNYLKLVTDSAFGFFFIDANAYRDLSGHTRSDDTMLKLLNDDTLISHRLDSNSVANGIFVLEGKNYFVVSSSSNSTENGLAGHHIERAL